MLYSQGRINHCGILECALPHEIILGARSHGPEDPKGTGCQSDAGRELSEPRWLALMSFPGNGESFPSDVSITAPKEDNTHVDDE